MSETDMNFGPEWLHKLTRGKSNSPPSNLPTSNYPMAEYCYGREEMLAIFNTSHTFEGMKEDCQFLLVPQKQFPIAFETQSEEEREIWLSNINSDLALRSKLGTTNGDRGARGGRGLGSMDRGRGRGRMFYQRHEEEESNSSYARTRINERPPSLLDRDSNRWEERDRRYNNRSFGRGNNNVDESRKESSALLDNWRKPDKDRETEDAAARRSSSAPRDKFIGGRGSWRKSDRYREDPDSSLKPISSNRPLSRKQFEEDPGRDFLPEWSVEEGHDDKTGSFDESGAFRNNSSEEEDSSDPESVQTKTSPADSSSNKFKEEEMKVKTSSPLKIPPKVSTPLEQSTLNNTSPISLNSTPRAEEKQHLSHLSYNIPPVSNSSPNISISSQMGLSMSPIQLPIPAKPAIKENETFSHLITSPCKVFSPWKVEEEDQRLPNVKLGVEHHTNASSNSHQDSFKWFYTDPQGNIQGPFSSEEMLEWYSVGYFDNFLLVRRGCDESFAQIGDLVKIWGTNPFTPNLSPPPPLRNSLQPSMPIIPPSLVGTTATSIPSKHTQAEFHSLVQQQQQQQLMNQQQYIIRQIYAKLKQQDEYNKLPQAQQQSILYQHLANIQTPRQNPDASSLIEPLSSLQMKSNGNKALWGSQPSVPGNWSIPPNTISSHPGNPPSVSQYWDTLEIEKEKRKSEEAEMKKIEEEKRKLLEEKKKQEEKERLQEEKDRKQEEERFRIEELLKHQEEEKKRIDKLRREQEEEFRRKQEEEDRRRKEEQKLQEELRRKHEEQKRVLDERKRKEEKRILEEKLKKEREHQQRKLEESRLREEMMEKKKKEEMKLQWEQEHYQEQEKREMYLRELEHKKYQEHMAQLEKQKQIPQLPAWGSINSQPLLSLAEIQKIEEEKVRENERKMKANRQNQALNQAANQKLTWAQRSISHTAAPKSLLEIQKEEAEKNQQQQKHFKQSQQTVYRPSASMGAWNNGSQNITRSLSNFSAASVWEDTPVAAVKSPISNKPSKSCDFPTVVNKSVSNNKNKDGSKNKKGAEKIMKIHLPPQDEFTQWCVMSLEALSVSSVDIPTFVSFLKEIDSPFEVNDYVKSYFGENRESHDFAQSFIENRIKYRNQKKKPEEENMWGPAPAVNPKLTQHVDPDTAKNSTNKGKKKKNKKMQKVDNSLLGFTVNQDTNRINAGDLEHFDG